MADDAGADRVQAAFEAVPREGFLPAEARRRASYDGPIDIGHGQTNSQPWTVRTMLTLLDVREGHHVLDVGAGSGWTTALLAHLVGRTGRVRGVEVVPDLAEWGAENLAATSQSWATLETPEQGVLGLPAHAPYDRVLVSAEPRRLPQELVDQVGDDGRMVIPVAGVMLLVVKEGGEVQVTRQGHYRFVPLV
ncbi:MAG TPA: protein-L-isoaspartate O-methyltransferase [Marmoricola sp.]|nr:protein-L-isoaspartate O-methyltransferase [Marmoricola sp.]